MKHREMKISCVTKPTLNLPAGNSIGRRELSDRIVAENCRTDGQALTLARRLGRLLPLLSLRAAFPVAAIAAAVAAGVLAVGGARLAGLLEAQALVLRHPGRFGTLLARGDLRTCIFPL